MAEVQTQIEQDDVDTTAEKAAEIGKELGVEDPRPGEDIPDYDIEEVEDEKIAKEREPAERVGKKDRPKLSNKEKRELKKKRLGEKFDAKDSEIRRLREENEQFKNWKSQVDGRLANINRTEVDNAWNSSVAAFNAAEQEHQEAFKEGDGVKATQAMRKMYDAQKAIDQIQGLKQQLDKQPQAEQPRQAGPDPRMVKKANAWAAKHSWYNPNGNDVDSEIAKTVSGVLANEGLDPTTDEFWDELDERLAAKLPDKYDDAEDEDEDEVEEEKPRQRKRTGPPVAGGTARGDVAGKVKISLPTAFINTLKDNGIWADEAKRNRVIAGYLKQQKENKG